jgi:glycosyltransferase involved in cell wall biosynthesis
VRNEAWVLERFLRAASTWADVIIVLDHASTDGSAEIAKRFPKVHLTSEPRPSYAIHRARLVEVARAVVPSPHVLVALDADEFIASDAWHHPEMSTFLSGPPGTLATMRWINVLPHEPRAWIPATRLDFMFVDDGSAFTTHEVHGPRLPHPAHGAVTHLEEAKVIHLQYLDWARMRAKQRWYQAQERLEQPKKRPIQIYRQYHHMDAIPLVERHDLRAAWFSSYDRDSNPSLLTVEPSAAYSTDRRVLDLLTEYGAQHFRRIDLWGSGWEQRLRALGEPVPAARIGDPHTRIDRLIFRWLARTQGSAHTRRVRWIQRTLRLSGW